MQAPDKPSSATRAEQDAQVPGAPAARRGMLAGGGRDSRPQRGRGREIDTRLDAVRTRLRQLRERDLDAVRSRDGSRERVEAARRHAVEAHAAAARVLAYCAEAFRRAAEAHDRAASMQERTAAAGIGDVIGHEQQAALHRVAAAADRQRAERAWSLLADHERAGPAAVSDEPRGDVVR